MKYIQVRAIVRAETKRALRLWCDNEYGWIESFWIAKSLIQKQIIVGSHYDRIEGSSKLIIVISIPEWVLDGHFGMIGWLEYLNMKPNPANLQVIESDWRKMKVSVNTNVSISIGDDPVINKRCGDSN